MKAFRLHPNHDQSNPYSAANPAPLSALILDSDLPIPEPVRTGELLIKIEATTIVRDCLTWPETYDEEYKILGWDFAGTVVRTASDVESFKLGDEVYGMTSATRAGTWAEHAIILADEACLKPKYLTWAEAAAVPMSGLTAYQALFVQAGLVPPTFHDKLEVSRLDGAEVKTSVLVTGASGGVGLYVVRLAKLAGLHVVAATRSTERNRESLEKLGADELVEYTELNDSSGRFQIIVDTVGGQVLENCWLCVKEDGAIVTIDSASFDFPQEHKKLGLHHGREDVNAKFFIVSPSSEDLKSLSVALDLRLLQPSVADVLPLSDLQQAYNPTSTNPTARGKVVLVNRAV